jgi:hypothetical protein
MDLGTYYVAVNVNGFVMDFTIRKLRRDCIRVLEFASKEPWSKLRSGKKPIRIVKCKIVTEYAA